MDHSIVDSNCSSGALKQKVSHLLGHFRLRQLRIRLLCFLAGIHTEEVEGGLVGLGAMGVLGELPGKDLHHTGTDRLERKDLHHVWTDLRDPTEGGLVGVGSMQGIPSGEAGMGGHARSLDLQGFRV